MNYALIKKLLPWCLMAAAILALEAGFYQLGYKSAERHYQQKLAEQQLAATNAALQAAEAARTKEQKNARKLAEALAARDKALSDAASLRRRAGRVRQSTADTADKFARLSAASASTSDSNGQRVSKCERLLSESASLLARGSELAAEGAELSARISADKDTIAAVR